MYRKDVSFAHKIIMYKSTQPLVRHYQYHKVLSGQTYTYCISTIGERAFLVATSRRLQNVMSAPSLTVFF